jgi:hypothetical protein
MSRAISAERRKENWGELGPAIRALTQMQRDFVRHYLAESMIKPYGAGVRAAVAAGYMGKNRASTSKIAHFMLHDRTRNEKVQAAITEESRRLLRFGAPEALGALFALVRNPEHKDHIHALRMVISRTDPEVSRQDVNVTHRHIDPDQEELEELRAMRALDVSREKLIEMFGGNGLARLEKLEAAEQQRRAAKAKIIEGEVIEP